jgi:hypothetical protein
MKAVVVIVLLTRPSLRLGSVREPVNLALLDRVISRDCVSCSVFDRANPGNIKSITGAVTGREPGPEGRSCLCRRPALGLTRRG